MQLASQDSDLRSTNWSLIILLAALVGVLAGYVYTLIAKPQLLPPVLRIGSLHEPMTVLVLGVDVVYSDRGRNLKADKDAFTGRSDTIMVCRLDPYRNSLGVLNIPRDTQVRIPGNGTQKINAANAIGGPYLAQQTVSQFLGIPIDHYIVLNVHGLVDLVNELGGITIDIPKKMQYMDWTAKLKIDLEPGVHTLTGNQAMGFVRFRHDALGDIGRVQRQELFMRAVLDRAMRPESWSHIPRLMQIAQNYINTDMQTGDLMMLAQYARGVPKSNQFMAMMPGNFSGSGDWDVSRSEVRHMVGRLMGSAFITAEKNDMRIAVENDSATKGLGNKLAKFLRDKGYRTVMVRANNEERPTSLKRTKIIAQRGNPEDAEIVKTDLRSHGDIVTASVGDIESSVTIMIGDDLAEMLAD